MADDGIDDSVTLTLGGDVVVVAEGYDIRQSILQQPGDFSLRLGQGSQDAASDVAQIKGRPSNLYAADLVKAYPPNTPFELRIAGQLRMTGNTDGYRASAQGGGGTEVTIFGRDSLAPLHDAHVAKDLSFKDDTYLSLVEKAFKIVNLDPSLIDETNAKNRKVMSGVNVRELLPPRSLEELTAEIGTDATNALLASGAHAVAHKEIAAKIGMRWYEFIRRQLDRAGLFLWAAANGRFVLSAPNAHQMPIYQIVRKRGQSRNAVNVVHADLLYDTRPQYCYAIVYGRGGGRGSGRHQSLGSRRDQTMLDLKFDPERALVIHDSHCGTNAQAAYLASRKLAEARRHGYQLVYVLAGHSTSPTANGINVWGSSLTPAVWTPDTVVRVDDDEFGIHDEFRIETVEFRRQPHATTTIRLMKQADVIFGEAEFE